MTEPRDILLLNTRRDYFGSLPGDVGLGTNLLAVFLEEKGYRAGLFRGPAHRAWPWLEDELTRGGRSVGFYCDYENQDLVAGLSRRVKDRWDVPVFVGGPQSGGLGEDFFRRSGCDAVVRGEGEYPLLELLEHHLRGGPGAGPPPGVTYLGGDGRLAQGPPREPIADLDALPWPDFGLEEGGEGAEGGGPGRALPVMTGRGCPFNCAFCHEGGTTKRVRYRGVDNVMAEIAHHFRRQPHLNYILFLDDTFTLDPRRVEEFCRRLKELRRERDFVWFCEGHVQTIHKWPDMIPQMVDAGLVKLVLGIESGSDRVLSLYRKKITADMMESVAAHCHASGVPLLSGNFIVGGPEEDDATLAAGLELATRLLTAAPGRIDLYSFFLMPYPGTAITADPGKFGLRPCPARAAHSLADIPLFESRAMPWEGMFQARDRLNRHILETMRDIHRRGLVPRRDVVQSFRLAQRYGVYSRWLTNVFGADQAEAAYWQALASGALASSQDIPPEDLPGWRPQRMFPFWSRADYRRDGAWIGDMRLSSLEKELLLLSSGKLPLGRVLETARRSLGKEAWDEKVFASAALKVLRRFEERRWLAYARY